MSETYTVTVPDRLNLSTLLDAVGALIEPNPTHPPSTDTLILHGTPEGTLRSLSHSRLGITVAVTPVTLVPCL